MYNNFFRRLAFEEQQHSLEDDYPLFGLSTWTWTGETVGTAARKFYNVWTSFSTVKDFAWVELWNASEAPDRRVRRFALGLIPQSRCCKITNDSIRLMEKDNRKVRDDARKEYNETVRVSTNRCEFGRSNCAEQISLSGFGLFHS